MSDAEDDQEETIFEAALAASSDAERDTLLDSLCRDQPQLRARVERLLAAYAASQSLETPLADMPEFEAYFGSLEGKQVGTYDVLQRIGEGGMGEVYLARSVITRQLVAIKTIKPGMDTRQVVSRFEQERKALQRLSHPHIAEFIEAGVTHSGRAYFVMELVRGIPVTDFCKRRQCDLQQTLRLFVDICTAVHYANRCGMVHRDLKPNNLLVTDAGDKPVVKVIDFGIGKALTPELKVDTLFTGAVHWLGTPAYMSPEQSQWSHDVDQRSDVYALGVVLFELLTGTTPLALAMPPTKSFETARALIAERLPPRPSQTLRASRFSSHAPAADSIKPEPAGRFQAQQLRGDLDWIALKALEKHPNDRYQQVEQLANDVIAYLNDEPITASRPAHMRGANRAYQFIKHSRAFWLSTAVFAIVVSSLLSNQLATLTREIFGAMPDTTNVSSVNESPHVTPGSEGAQASKRQKLTERLAFVTSVRRANELRSAGRFDEAVTQLQSLKQTHAQWLDSFLVRYLQQVITTPELFETQPLGNYGEMDLSPQGNLLVMGDAVGNVKLWDWPSGKLKLSWKAGDKEIQRVRFAPSGQWLATVGQDKQLIVWDFTQGKPIHRGTEHQRTINGLSWSSDSQLLATSDRDGVVIVWKAEDLSIVKKLQVDSTARVVEFSQDGKYLAAANDTTGTQVWNTSDWSEKTFIQTPTRSGDQAIAFSPNGRIMAVGGYGPIRVVDLTTGTKVMSPTSMMISALRFGPHGNLYIGRQDGHVDIVMKADRGWLPLASLKMSHGTDRVKSIVFFDNDRYMGAGLNSTGHFRWMSIESVLGFDPKISQTIPLGYNAELKMHFDSQRTPHVLQGWRNQKLEFSLTCDARIDHALPLYFRSRDALAFSTAQGSNSKLQLISLANNQILDSTALNQSVWHIKPIDEHRALLALSKGLPAIWDIQSNQILELKHPDLSGQCVTAYSTATQQILVAAIDTRIFYRFTRAGEYLGQFEHTSKIYDIDYSVELDAFLVGEIGGVSLWSSDLELKQTFLLAESGKHVPTARMARYLPHEHLIAVAADDSSFALIDIATELVAIHLPTHLATGSQIYFMSFENNDRLTFGYGSAKEVLTLNTSPRSSAPGQQ